MAPIDLSKALAPFERQWVAIKKGTTDVIAHGETLKQVCLDAEKMGINDAVFTFVPPFDSYFASVLFKR